MIGTAPALAQSRLPVQPDAAVLLRDIERLSTVGRVLYVAAHPDDENTRLLSWLIQNQKVRAAYLSLTRGEGGQNLIGPEQAPLLGVIRTQELLAARSIDGAEQFFGEERDFGYSKTPEETLSIWGKEDALGDVVWVIRRFRPDVIITRFSPEDRQTHGHHTASAMLSLEAFKLAGDPKAYPEQLKTVSPWQPKRIVWNKGVFGPGNPADVAGFAEMDVGGYDPLLGVSPGEVAARSRSMHRSQGFGSSPLRGPVSEYFRLLAGAPFQRSFLEGIDLSWSRVPGSEKLRQGLSEVRARFDPHNPAASIPALFDTYDALDALPDSPWKPDKRAELTRVISACAGFFADATSDETTAVPGTDVKVMLTALNRSPAAWSLHSVRILDHETVLDRGLETNRPVTIDQTVRLPPNSALSTPYWLVEQPSPGRWTVHDPTLAGLPEQPSPLLATFVVTAGPRRLEIVRPVAFAWTDPASGERRRPLEVLPSATLNPSEPLLMFPEGVSKELRVTVRATRGALSGVVQAEAPTGFRVEPVSQPYAVADINTVQELTFRVQPPERLGDDGVAASGVVRFLGAPAPDARPAAWRSVTRIEYPHIPTQTLAPLAEVKVVRFAMKRAVSRVGYIPGPGDEVPAALRQVGYEVTVLSDAALEREPLDRFQAIVIGVRAFNTNPRLPQFHARLMEYVERGGTIIAQYNTNNRISKITGDIGPWPFSISQERVTDEKAAVERLVPAHRIFTAPNRIDDADFSGWVQERGLYFADRWDDHYQPLLAMNDPGEPPRKGSLLVAHRGKGVFIYTGLSFFRQLPAGVPGAYRLFANLLSAAGDHPAHGQ
jgi:LmbE family N-acetylglucosaminyl deacetylase